MRGIEIHLRAPTGEAFAALFDSTGWNQSYAASQAELSIALDRSWLVASAYHDDTLVGVGRIVSDGVLYAMLYDVIVRPDYRRLGIGRTLVARLVGRCKAAGIRDVQLFAARGTGGFYRSLGFKERPENAPGMYLETAPAAGA